MDRVEICIGGIWGTVCDELFENREAEVVCRQLGYSTAEARSYDNAFFGEGTGPVFLDGVSCTGSEETLISCPRQAMVADGCRHNKDAGVQCSVPEGVFHMFLQTLLFECCSWTPGIKACTRPSKWKHWANATILHVVYIIYGLTGNSMNPCMNVGV